MEMSKIQMLDAFGQSVWLDYISRELLNSGKISDMIDAGVMGMTSNPTIFDTALRASAEYDSTIAKMAVAGNYSFEIYDELTVKDIRNAADFFRDIYEESYGADGYVSLEINPHFADMPADTFEEGLRLYKKVGRPNVMFKVPATEAGLEAVEVLLGEGININVTLIFSQDQYAKTVAAYFRGINRALERGKDARKIRSVASVFVSRVDTAVDCMLNEKIYEETVQSKRNELEMLKGKAAVANAEVIYDQYVHEFSRKSFYQLKAMGANVQRLLWASTGTKDPSYSDIKYVTELIGKATINTMPRKTLLAFLDHGEIHDTMGDCNLVGKRVLDRLWQFGIDINAVCDKLQVDGVAAFEISFEQLLSRIEEKARKLAVDH